MKLIRVVFGTGTPIGLSQPDTVRTMTMEFSSAKKAASFAADLVYVLDGPKSSSARSDGFYTVNRKKPRARFDNNARTWWVEVQFLVPERALTEAEKSRLEHGASTTG